MGQEALEVVGKRFERLGQFDLGRNRPSGGEDSFQILGVARAAFLGQGRFRDQGGAADRGGGLLGQHAEDRELGGGEWPVEPRAVEEDHADRLAGHHEGRDHDVLAVAGDFRQLVLAVGTAWIKVGVVDQGRLTGRDRQPAMPLRRGKRRIGEVDGGAIPAIEGGYK